MPPEPREGDDWDGFVLRRTLYRSPAAVLVLASDTVERRTVVLKIPRPGTQDEAVLRAGFVREATLGMSVRSRFVVNALAVPSSRQTRLYLVMPHYRGETLEERLQRAPPVGLLEGVGIALKLTAAVSDLAAAGVVHRDLKPENVILPIEGGLRLLDLGLAYLPGMEDLEGGLLGGTTRYMAPELFRGTPANARSEVFSLGVMLYRMFAGGRFPFGQRETVPFARLRPDLPPWVGACLAPMLAADPNERPSDAASVAVMLEDGLQTGAPSAPRRAPDSVVFWQALAIVFAVLALALALTLLTKTR